MPTLAKQLGFSSVVTGTIYTVLPIIGMLAKPLFGLIGDKLIIIHLSNFTIFTEFFFFLFLKMAKA